MTENKGRVTVISGFAGAGKGTQVNCLLQNYSNYVISISWTTRAPRGTEQNGKEYFFVSQEEFDRAVEEDQFLEHAVYTSSSYGTPKGFVLEQCEKGKNVLLEIEVQGGVQIKKKYPEAVMIFLMTPSAEILEKRLSGRGTETYDKVTDRLARAVEELDYISEYDYVIVNDDMEACTKAIHQAINTGKSDKIADAAFIDKFREELRQIVERRKKGA